MAGSNDKIDNDQQPLIQDLFNSYSEKVIERCLNPRFMGEMEYCQGYGKITGPCGDTIEFYLKIENDMIVDTRFNTDGCATTIAAAGMAAELSIGKNIHEAFKISQQSILTALDGLPEDSVHCALLASNTLKEALNDYLDSKREPWKMAYKKF